MNRDYNIVFTQRQLDDLVGLLGITAAVCERNRDDGSYDKDYWEKKRKETERIYHAIKQQVW